MSVDMMLILEKVGFAALILVVGYIAIIILLRVLKKVLQHSGLDEALHLFIINMVRVVLWIVLLVTILGYLEVPTAPLVTVLGAAGAAVALALKDSLGNFAGGILILVTKPYNKGDYIETSETAGSVEKIDLLYTTLKTPDNKVITVPNGKLANSSVTNYSSEPIRRVDCKFGVSYGDDMLKAMEILQTVAESNKKILKKPEFIIGVAAQEDSRIALDLKVWTKTKDFEEVSYYLKEQVKLAFDEAGITIPFPQMEVRVKK